MAKRVQINRVVRGIGLLGIAVVALAILYAMTIFFNTQKRLAVGAFESWTEQPFYELPQSANIPKNKPGSVIRTQKLYSTPQGIDGWRVMYTSTDRTGNDIVVTGIIAAPAGLASGQKRTVVAWGHPTTGTAQRCAPSVGIDPFDTIEGLRDLVAHGYIVVATDYSGMGAAGPPSFLIGETEGRNMLDIVRAVQKTLPENTTNDVILWGHSQGGHAALFAEQIATTYASELTVKGVATAAPATQLGDLLEADAGDVSGITIGSYAMQAYSTAYGQNLTTILTPDGQAATPTMATLCLIGQNQKLHEIATPLIGKYFTSKPTTTQPWADILKQNTPGQSAIKTPLFVAQGQSDTLVNPQITQQFVDNQVALGATVTFVPIANTGHGMVALRAIPQLIDWMKQL